MDDKKKLDVFVLVGTLAMIAFFVFSLFMLDDAARLYNKAYDICYQPPDFGARDPRYGMQIEFNISGVNDEIPATG